jgi:hypothetical protein
MKSVQTKIDPAQLDADELPVDAKNIIEIERQIIAWGGIHTPVEVWRVGMRIMDGFHRTKSALKLGMPQIPILLFDCTEEEFWDKRISQAKKHVAVADDRLYVWILSAWQVSQFAKAERNQGFVDAIYTIHQSLTGAKNIKVSPEWQAMMEWFKKKASMWGRPPVEVAGVILEHEKVFAANFPEAKAIAREQDLNAEQAKKLTKSFPAGNKVQFGKGLSRAKMRQYAAEVIKSGSDISLDEWQAEQKQKVEQSQQRRAVLEETPAGLEEKRRRRIENGVTAIQALRMIEHRVTDLLNLDLAEILLARPDLSDSVKKFFAKVSELGAKFDQSGVYAVLMDTERVNLLGKIAELERELMIAHRQNNPTVVDPSVLALSESQIN